MDKKAETKLSKFLSYVLRHHPDEIGIELDEQGWVDVDDLLEAAASKDRRFSRDDLEHVVANNAKKRFAFSDDGTRIRANQGHSIEVDLDLPPAAPPDVLYHGTVDRFLDSIFDEGLKKGSRHHVHLSKDVATATNVGQRRGKPVLLIVDAAAMAADGHTFHLSKNGVWLIDHVPPKYLTRKDGVAH